MDVSIYIIILFLIILKMMIWVCVFYSRQQRRRRLLENNRGIIIIPGDVVRARAANTRDRDHIIPNEHIPGYPVTGLDNPGMTAPYAPPTYDEVQQSKAMAEKPPSYDQVMSAQSTNTASVGNSSTAAP